MGLKSVDAKTLRNWLENKEAILLDVREPAEHAAENIQGATLLPLSTISIASLPAHAGKKLVIHCRKGGRSGSACQKLLAEDPSLELYNLEGGIDAWNASGLQCSTSGKFFLPLDQQVQLTVGLGILISSILALEVNPSFLYLTAFLGAGLTVAGLTGFCALARVMARMPWNQ